MALVPGGDDVTVAGERMRLAAARFACAAAILTAVCLGVPLEGLGAEPSLRTALDSAAAPVAALLAFLLYGRFRESRLVSDGVLAAFLLLVAISNLLLSALPKAFDAPTAQVTDRTAFASVLAALLFVVAVRMPARRWSHGLGAGAALIVCTAGAAALVSRVAGSPVLEVTAPSLAPDSMLVTAQLAAACLFLIGAWGNGRCPTFDRLQVLLAGAAVLWAVSRIDAVLAVSSADAWSTASLLLRAGAYSVLVAAASVEISDYWRRMAHATALEERRRLSRDLHDGIAQDLAFAAGQARFLARRSDHPDRARMIIAATERALDECRNALAALNRPLDEPLHVALTQCAEEMCDRFQTRLDLDLDLTAAVTPEVHQGLVRIVREAVGNAGRHGQAGHVAVHLRQEDGLILAVDDDGSGFDTSLDQRSTGRFGLVSMRERAEALGGTFSVRSEKDGGTRVEIRLP